ncbi:non-canonical purine NTP diphosphatase [Nibrella saemangeumensis]|uniref:dITP/XTP pyrophosphatase n=1 Tax=Nibrella saemangeumensis TaxID=1084526 RepID=A0ABP8MYI2_9BACT
MELCFATNNPHKLEEVTARLGHAFTLKTLQDIGCTESLPETQTTIAGNSRQKAEFVWTHYAVSCFADDTGLEVDALNGEPGVNSAFYAGLPRDNSRNVQKLLSELNGVADRRAHFRTVFTLILHGVEYQFEGIIGGHIITEPRGTGGFGYDPVFVPDGFDQTLGEMTMEQKNQISHRARALDKMVEFLQTI